MKEALLEDKDDPIVGLREDSVFFLQIPPTRTNPTPCANACNTDTDRRIICSFVGEIRRNCGAMSRVMPAHLTGTKMKVKEKISTSDMQTTDEVKQAMTIGP